MLIIFDVDGTLLDSWDWMAGELVGSAARFGYKQMDRAELERLRGLETREVLAALQVSPERAGELVTHLRDSAEIAAAELHLFAGVPELLAELTRAGDRLALVSTNSDAAVRAGLGTDVDAMFAHRRCGAGVFDKAAAFGEIVAEAGADRSDVLAVGDETRDLDAAAQAGIAAVAVEWGYADASLLRGKALGRTASDVRSLAAMIENRRGSGRPLP